MLNWSIFALQENMRDNSSEMDTSEQLGKVRLIYHIFKKYIQKYSKHDKKKNVFALGCFYFLVIFFF